MRLKVFPSEHDTSAGILAMKLMKSWFKRMLEVDSKAALLPWKKSDMSKKAILSMKAFPVKLSNFRLYTDRFRPKADSNVWLKLHIACVAETKEFLSQDDSKMSDWYDTNDSAAYEASVQESDDTILLGDFMYSGSFLNQVRVQEQIKKAIEVLRHAQAQKRKQKSFDPVLIGVRGKKNREMEALVQKVKILDWVMAPDQMLHVEVDRAQANRVKKELYVLFNNTKPGAQPRPGGYNMRFLPDQILA